MKLFLSGLVLCFFANCAHGARLQAPGDTIKKVVTMLEDMLEKSKRDGDNDRELYAKYLCYCNNQKETKTKEIEDLTTDISLLENQIEELLASNGELSTEVAKLKEDIAEKQRQIDEANKLQDDRQKEWDALSKDLTDSIASMKAAIKVLAEVGADQTLEEGTHTAAADHTKFMAGYKASSLLKVNSVVKDALVAAQAFMPEKQSGSVQSFLQAPFTGTYTSQSGEVMGILKNMRDTFKANYQTAETTFNKQTEAHNALVKKLGEAKGEMEKMQKKKEGDLGDNDSSLATARSSYEEAKKSKQAKEDFLEELLPICERKGKEYEERNVMRANEDAAITQAISILNKDSSFHAFQKVQATNFLQTSSVKRVANVGRRSAAAKEAQQLLMKAASGSIQLTRIAALIEANNPFEVVMAEIKKMIAVIDKEQTTDAETLKWCNDERAEAARNLKEKETQIIALNKQIDTLVNEIDAPDTGLKAMIQKTEDSLVQNDKDQKTETADRIEANQVYQQAIANQVEAEDLVKSAINVLNEYYSQISLVQVGRQEPEVVEKGPWSGDYKGQSDSGNKVIEMLDYILKEAEKEEETTHATEQSDQHAYEDSMANLKSQEKQLQETLATLKLNLAEAEKELAEARQELKKTEAEKAAIENYLLQIKPGCDFITNNFQLRTEHRAAEKTGLTGAYGQLKRSAAFTNYEAEQHLEDLGDCKDICLSEGEDHVKCLACRAKVTVPGYCAGHDDVKGC